MLKVDVLYRRRLPRPDMKPYFEVIEATLLKVDVLYRRRLPRPDIMKPYISRR